jgi:hypothetical protein
MRRLLLVSAAATAMLAIVASAVFWAGDRQTTVPPPEAVGEQLLRQLHARRQVRTAQFLTPALESQWTPDRLGQWWQQIEHQAGEVEQITGDENVIQGDEAEAEVIIQGRTRSLVLRLRMKREHGLWEVAQFPPEQ